MIRHPSTTIPDVLLIEPVVLEDERGQFAETWNARSFAALGVDAAFVQDNLSRSAVGVLRGLHYQIKHPQGKLVRVVAGSIFDVCVDLRRSSTTFGRSVTATLSADDGRMLWIPSGFAHGFLSLRDDTEVSYKCTDFYAPEYERVLAWNDPQLGIAWPIDIEPILSSRDRAGVPLERAETYP